MEEWLAIDQRSLKIVILAAIHFASALCAFAHINYVAEYLNMKDPFRKWLFLFALFSLVGGPLSLVGWGIFSKSKGIPFCFRFWPSE